MPSLPNITPSRKQNRWPMQAAFLREARDPYSDWAEVVDELNERLRD